MVWVLMEISREIARAIFSTMGFVLQKFWKIFIGRLPNIVSGLDKQYSWSVENLLEDNIVVIKQFVWVGKIYFSRIDYSL